MIRTLIKDRISFDKYNKLEQEIYKLFVNNCKDIKDFLWKTTQSLSQYSGASTCFSRLSSLGIDLEFVNSTALFGMAQICQNIEDLKIWFYNGNISGLIMFLDNQKNLRSLYLYFKGSEKQCIELSEVIEKKADTLKELSIKPNITLISPKFLPSLINLQYLELYNKIELEEEIVEMEEWENYLSISTFPNLQYIKTLFLPICSDYKLIEKSHENILEIKIYRRYEDQDSIYTEKLIKAIANHCPKIERLTINAELKNLNGIKEILLNCSRLKRIDLSAYNEKRLNCDELLEVLVNFSSNTLYIFSFIDNWNFSVNSLKSFFENWKDKHPIIFIESFDEGDWFLEHKMIVKKYIDEGVIKKTNCLLMM
ncbi:hypothetical protein C1645_740801 [Glomus cerebriforme]|uniref:F-box domain-containing protein n=1 Tax=Glomus cerebriforme TaxID=658196 RepID=A0A397SUV1_9GLOM|nr:hypothetical protein C1645_740801 [Glomus cerebriforme]